jgi:hypothetical protein
MSVASGTSGEEIKERSMYTPHEEDVSYSMRHGGYCFYNTFESHKSKIKDMQVNNQSLLKNILFIHIYV